MGIQVSAVSTAELARWFTLQAVPVPALLAGSALASYVMTDGEVEAFADTPHDVLNEASPSQVNTHDFPAAVRQPLVHLAEICARPALTVAAFRRDLRSGTGSITAVIRRGQRAVLVDVRDERTYLSTVLVAQMGAALLERLPRLSPAAIQPLRLSPRALEALSTAGSASWRGRAAIAAAAGTTNEALSQVEAIDAASTAKGAICALVYHDDQPLPVELSADWYESGRGAMVASLDGDGSVTFEAAAPAVMARVVATILGAAAGSTAARPVLTTSALKGI